MKFLVEMSKRLHRITEEHARRREVSVNEIMVTALGTYLLKEGVNVEMGQGRGRGGVSL